MRKFLHLSKHFFHKLQIHCNSIIKSHNHFFYVVKSIFISIIVSTILMVVVYLFLPKSSWINLHSTPNNFELYNFTGEFVLTTNTLKLSKGILKNSTSISVLLNNEIHKLNEGEFEIRFINDTKIDTINKGEDFPDLFSCYAIFDKQIKVDGYMQSNYGICDGILQIQKQYSIFRKDLNIENTLADGEIYSVLLGSDNTMTNSIFVYDDTTMIISPNVQIYICGNKINVPEGESIKLSSGNSNAAGAILDFSTNMVRYDSLDMDNYCYIEGRCTKFNGKSSGDNSVLKQTYLNTQKEFDISLLNVTSFGKEPFQMEFELSKQINNIQISGQSQQTTLANTPLNFNFITFLSDNLGAIISAIFAAFIAAYIPMVLTTKEDERRQDNE